jgi:hypothetical protein
LPSHRICLSSYFFAPDKIFRKHFASAAVNKSQLISRREFTFGANKISAKKLSLKNGAKKLTRKNWRRKFGALDTMENKVLAYYPGAG